MQNKVLSTLRNQDLYGQEVKLTIDGEDACKTALGGVFTLMGKLFISVLIVINVMAIYNHKHSIYRETKPLDTI